MMYLVEDTKIFAETQMSDHEKLDNSNSLFAFCKKKAYEIVQ